MATPPFTCLDGSFHAQYFLPEIFEERDGASGWHCSFCSIFDFSEKTRADLPLVASALASCGPCVDFNPLSTSSCHSASVDRSTPSLPSRSQVLASIVAHSWCLAQHLCSSCHLCLGSALPLSLLELCSCFSPQLRCHGHKTFCFSLTQKLHLHSLIHSTCQ